MPRAVNEVAKAELLRIIGPAFPGADDLADALAPSSSTAAPDFNATRLGQMHIKTDTGKVYISVAVGSETPSNDWAIQN
jgi:hypothetical protein